MNSSKDIQTIFMVILRSVLLLYECDFKICFRKQVARQLKWAKVSFGSL